MSFWKVDSRPKSMIEQAFGAERGAALTKAEQRLAGAFPSPDVLVLVQAIAPDAWGAVREVFTELRRRDRGAIAALPAVAAWLKIAPSRIGIARGYLTGWETWALSEGWQTAAVLHRASLLAMDRCSPGPVADALALASSTCEADLLDEAIRVLGGELSQAQRGAIDFFKTITTRVDEARTALLMFGRSPSPLDDAGLGYARGEALSAYATLEKRLPTLQISTEQAVPEDSWQGRLTAFRALVSSSDDETARRAARELLLTALPPTPVGDALRQEALAVLSRPPVSAPALAPSDIAIAPSESPRRSDVRAKLFALAAGEQPTTVRVAALEALARSAAHHDDAYVEVVLQAADDEDSILRELAARLLGDLDS